MISLAFVPFNMGGCSGSNVDIGAVVQGGTKMFQSQTLSEKDEDSIGQSVAVQATNRWRVYSDDNLNRYCTLVARVIAASSGQSQIKPNVAVLDTTEVNAFSGPHGYIFITRGALTRMHDESELAGVLAHEFGHLAKHHGLNAVRSSGFMDGFLTAAKGSSDQVRAFGNVADGAGEAVINTGFSQPQEEEADKAGVGYLIAAGYDPNGFLHFLQRIQQEQGAGGKPFGTHPGIGDRIKKVSDQIAKSGVGGQGATLPDRFGQYAVMR
jgi:predicted Zn-dependent protease